MAKKVKTSIGIIMYPSEEEQKLFYDNDTSKRRINNRLKVIEQYLIILFKQYPNIKTVLEVGCGVGITSKFMAGKGKEVVGVDFSEKHIEQCNQDVHGITFICDNFNRVELEGTFDLILLFDVLEHIPKPQHLQTFTQIKKYSHPQTIVAIIIPDPKALDKMRDSHLELLQPVDESIYPEYINQIFDSVGLEILEEDVRFQGDYKRYLLQFREN